MRRVLIALLLALLGLLPTQAQQNYLWPIAGASVGDSIISAPQSYIDKEHNFDGLFIGAKENTVVVSPCDGKIQSISFSYRESLTYSTFISINEKTSFDEAAKEIAKDFPKKWNLRYLSGSICIATSKGIKLFISGLRGKKVFKTGQKIHKGDTLGVVSYDYYKIKTPHINLSISKRTKPADPMGPFGLTTTFIPAKNKKHPSHFTQSQAQEDAKIARDAITRLYPSFYDVCDSATYKIREAAARTKIQNEQDEVTYATLRNYVKELYCMAHDSHIYLYPASTKRRYFHQPALFIGWINDTLKCTRAIPKYRSFLGQQIIKVDGYTADEFKAIVKQQITGYDLQSEAYPKYRLATTGFGYGLKDDQHFSMKVTFADGKQRLIPGIDIRKQKKGYLPQWGDFFRINRYREAHFKAKVLNDSVAYLGISTFDLSQVEMDSIKHFIERIKDKPYLVLDTRNNAGGNEDVVNELYSHLSDVILRTRAYNRMSVKGNDSLFNYTLNRKPDSTVFSEFEPLEHQKGYYECPEKGYYEWLPDSTLHYKGRIYALINERSISAAVLLPSMLMRARKAYVVGRETCTGYHFMTALKFVDLVLPHSGITLHLPLIQCFFDTAITSRTPKGRGLLPDVTVPITLADLSYERKDAVLNKALTLIEKGQYLSTENPFEQENKEMLASTSVVPEEKMNYLWWLLLTGITLGVVVLIVKRKKE
jgi:hypothetical protein